MLNINKQIGITYVDYSPAFFKRTINNYKYGYYRDIMALHEQAEMDSHVMGCTEGRQDGYKTSWRVTEISQSKNDMAIKDFVEAVFMELDMNDIFDFIHAARLKEFSVLDFTWEVINSKQWLTKIDNPNQKYFRRDVTGDNKIKLDAKSGLQEIPPDSALVCESIKIPLMIPVDRDFILKEFGIETFASFLENFGEGFIIGTYPPGASEAMKRELDEAVNAIGASSRGIKPEGTKIEIIESTKGTTTHKEFIEMAKAGIAVTLLGHENAVVNASGLQVGNNQSPYNAARAKVISDINFIEKWIYKLIKILVDRNFSDVKKYPMFSIDRSEPIDSTKRLAIIDSAYAKGYEVSADEYAKLGLIKSDTQEPFLKRDFNNPADTGF